MYFIGVLMYISDLGLSTGQMVPSIIFQDSQGQAWVMPRDTCPLRTLHSSTSFQVWLGRGSLLHLPLAVGMVRAVTEPRLEMSAGPAMYRELT